MSTGITGRPLHYPLPLPVTGDVLPRTRGRSRMGGPRGRVEQRRACSAARSRGMTRVLVIGAGHNGLVAAVHLAAAGLGATVLEHAPGIGGASSSVPSARPGFGHDHCAGFAPMAAVSPAIGELGLERDGLEWITPDAVAAHPFPDGTAFTLRRDVGA